MVFGAWIPRNHKVKVNRNQQKWKKWPERAGSWGKYSKFTKCNLFYEILSFNYFSSHFNLFTKLTHAKPLCNGCFEEKQLSLTATEGIWKVRNIFFLELFQIRDVFIAPRLLTHKFRLTKRVQSFGQYILWDVYLLKYKMLHNLLDCFQNATSYDTMTIRKEPWL